MATLIDMPKLSDTMTVGTLVKWLKKEGDAVANGDMIAEVETDKATMEVECFEDGVLLKQYCGAGDEVPVGGAIAAIGEAGEAAPEVSPTSVAPAEEAVEAPPPPLKRPLQHPTLLPRPLQRLPQALPPAPELKHPRLPKKSLPTKALTLPPFKAPDQVDELLKQMFWMQNLELLPQVLPLPAWKP